MKCPQPHELQQMLDESLPAAEQQALSTHLEGCPACQQTLERMAAGGVTWDKMAANLTDAPSDDAPALAGALKELQAQPTSGDQTRADGPPPSTDDDMSFLTPSTRPDSLGRLGHYEILEVLGKGGFGTVLRAFDDLLQRVVAIKVMAPHMAATSPARKRFLREARASAAVRHEYVVQIHAVEEQPIPHLVMEYIPGETLQKKLDDTGPLDAPEMLRLAVQIANGLAAAHAQGLIHRDIKPANILLEKGVETRVKLTDFGLARAADDASLTQSGVVAGTPMYMAPEQAEGQAIDQRADLFSLGSVFYVMLSGRPPFRASGTMAVLKRVCADAPRPIREIIPEAPEWLCDIITKLHAKKPEDRFQSAKEVADLLAQRLADVQAGRAIDQRAASVSERVEAPAPLPATPPMTGNGAPRRRWRIAAALGVIALLVVGLFASPFLYRYAMNQGTLIFSGTMDPNLDKILVKQKGETIAEMTIREGMVHIPAGDYQIEVVCKAGYELAKYRFGGTNSGATDWQIPNGTTFMVRLARADHISINVELAKLPDDPSKPPTPEPGWVQLFNGKDLTNWTVEASPNRTWSVEGSILIGTGRGEQLLSERKNYRDFHLRVEAKVNRGGNSGVLFRRQQDGSHQSYEAEINDMDMFKNGTLALHHVPAFNAVRWLHMEKNDHAPPEKWFTLEVIARGSHLVTIVNGKRCADVIDSTLKEGGIELQVFAGTTTVHFKKVEIKELPPADPPLVVAPFPDAEMKRIAALPAAAQVEEVRKELLRRNPGFDGKLLTHKIVDGVVTEVQMVTDRVKDISPLRVFQALRVLDCGGTSTNYRGNGQLADLTPLQGMNLAELTQLRLSWTKVDDAGLAHFKDCKNLKYLSLGGTQVGDAGLAHFKDCKNLIHLGLSWTKVDNAGLAHFKDCKNLTSLSLNGTQVSDAGLAHFKDCKNLTILSLDLTQVSDAGLAHIKDCKNLTSLSLIGTQVTDEGLAHFKDCKKLTELKLNETQVSDAGLAHFKDCKNLTNLHLSGTKVRNAGLAHFKDCKNLTNLHLNYTQVSDEGLVYFKDCKDLTSLSLSHTQVGDAGLAYFKDCKGLTDLQLSRTRVTDLSLLKGMPLKELTCDFHADRDAEILRSIKTLEKINGQPAAEFWKEVDLVKAGFAPFIILARDAQAQRKFATLAAAVKAAKSGDTIEIRGDGPFISDPVRIDKKALTIRAGKGFQPVLRMSPQDNKPRFLRTNAPLVLEGLDLQMVGLQAWDKNDPSSMRLIHIEKGPLHVANCRFTMSRLGGRVDGLEYINAYYCPIVEVRNCLHLEGGAFLFIYASPPQARFNIENCLLKAAEELVAHTHHVRDVRVGLRNNTYAGGAPCQILLRPNDKPTAGPCDMEWTGNIIASRGRFWKILQKGEKDVAPLSVIEAEKLLRGCVTLKEKGNVFSLPPGTEFLGWLIDYKDVPGFESRQTLAAWEQFWDLKDTGNIQATVRFKNSKALEQKEGLTPDDFRLLKGSPGQGVLPGGKDAGADVDLVGPGAAYERWQQTPAYQEWRKQTDDLMNGK